MPYQFCSSFFFKIICPKHLIWVKKEKWIKTNDCIETNVWEHWSKFLNFKLSTSQQTCIWIFLDNVSSLWWHSSVVFFIFFIYCWRYPWAHANWQEYALLLLQFNFHLFDYIFCLFCFNPIPLLLRQSRHCAVLDISTVHIRYAETTDFTLCNF